MFERFTNEGRRVLVLAQEVARKHGSPAIRRHHMLIGMLDEQTDTTAAAFDIAGIDRADLRARLVSSLTSTEKAISPDGAPPFTAESKKALELSLREALSLGHNYISDFHLLLGILRDANGPLAEVLAMTKLSYAEARGVVAQAAPERTGRRRGRRAGPVLGPMWRNTTPGFQAVLQRAAARSGNDRDTTTGDLLVALMETPGSHFAAALSSVSLPAVESVAAEVDRLLATGVVDGTEDAVRVDSESGSVTINDPQIAAELKKLLGKGGVTPDAIREILRRLQTEG